MQNESEKEKSTELKRLLTKTGLALINPLSDVRYLYRRGVRPMIDNLRRIRDTLHARSVAESTTPVSWAQAVEQTGKRADELSRNYRNIRLIWWLLMVVAGGLAVILVILLMFAGFNIPLLTLIHAAVTALVLSTAGLLGGVKTAEATWHLWQLSEQRVSEAERGSFRDFWAEVGGYQSLLHPTYRRRRKS